MADKNKRICLYLLIIVSLGLTIYSNTFGHKFVWDDDFLIVKNNFIKDSRYLPDIFTSELRVFSRDISNYYRPLQSVSYLIDYSIWRLDPFGYHLSNIILHILVSVLVFFLIASLSGNHAVSLLTSLLFLAHPVHTEVNSYISGRADSLSALFLLVSFILYIKHDAAYIGKPRARLYFWVSVFLFPGALLSKEVVLVFPLILFLYDFIIKKKRRPLLYLKPGIFLIISLAYILLRLTKLDFLASHELSIFSTASSSFFSRFITFPKIIFLYFKLLLMPFDLHLMRSIDPVRGLFSFEALLSLFFLAALCAGLFLIYRFFRTIFFYCVWFLVFLLPTLDLFPIGVSVAEHFLYLPSIGFFAAISTFFVDFAQNSRLFSRRINENISLILAAVIFSCLFFITYRQNQVWKDNFSLYSYLLKYVPNNHVIRNNLGNEYLKNGEYDKARTEFQKALQINPGYSFVYNNLGNLYLSKGNFDEAVMFYKKTIELRPDLAEPHDSLGKTYSNQGKYPEAASEFASALKIDPKYVSGYHNLGILNYKLGNKQTAIDYYKKAIEIDKKYIPAYYNIGFIYNNDGDYKTASEWWYKALDISPNDVFIKMALDSLDKESK